MSAAPATALVIVSHSARLAEGVVEVAAQMAPDVLLRAAGGTDDGGIGTSFDAVETAVTELLGTDGVDGVTVLTDLGSATMTAESVIEALEDDAAARVSLADGPLVEGAVAGAVAAQGGADHAAVAGAVAEAAGSFGARDVVGTTADAAVAGAGEAPGGGRAGTADEAGGSGEGLRRTFTLTNEVGLHARPAALLARLVAGYDATVTVNGVDGASVLSLMGLGLEKGDEMLVTASGPQAAEALEGVAGAVADGFGEQPTT
ncbi:PTS hybrid protein [Georgenia soli]|uniref:Phosphocarrier protein HPr n=1 Tax=Georgenia soli TaxID=638953 RepID=A0A2A9EJU4_9MICO|nr:dihydroxyacetone kinase phosphoryl donor subunit DhaM [Georgenia soli]PFG38515.1 PTS hybrid protein [Georgenia soli]